jgi:hypothetical protein
MPESADITFIGFYLSYHPIVIDISDHILRFLKRVVNLFLAWRFERTYILTRKLVFHTANYSKKLKMFKELMTEDIITLT